MKDEELTPEELENARIQRSLIVGGGSAGILGALVYGGAKGKLKFDKVKGKHIEDGTFLEYRKKFPSPIKPSATRLTEAEIEKVNKAGNIGKWMAITGGGAYVGTKAYEHYKNRKGKD